MSHSIVGSRARLEHFFLHGALNPFQSFLTRALVDDWARNCGHRWRAGLYTPLPTLLACIFKQLLPGTSCRDVEDWAAGLLPSIPRACDGDDFCLARKRLPEPVFERAVRHMGALAAANGRVWLVDGTGVCMPGTQANDRLFLRQSSSARMPCAHLLLFTDAASGAVMRADIADCRQAEMRQFLRCIADIPAGTVVVGDRAFGSYLALHELTTHKVGAVFRLHVSRKPITVKRLGKGDEIQSWQRPVPGDSAFPEQVRELPWFMPVRVVRRAIVRKGYRPLQLALATNLLDAAEWPADRIVESYLRRWGIENDIRDLKLRHGLELLSAKNPGTVRKEIWSALAAFNAVKVLQSRSGEQPRKLSHERSRTVIVEVSIQMAAAITESLPGLHQRLLARLSNMRLKQSERPPCPRALVRSPQKYQLMQTTRKQWLKKYLSH